MSLADRLLGAFDKLAASSAAREGLPDPRYSVPWSYSVTSSTDTTFTGRAISARCPHPDIRDVPNMPGVPGTLIRPAEGSIVGVLFLDGDPAQPRVVSWDTNTATIVVIDASQLLKLGPSAAAVEIAGGGPAVHRVGDFGQAGTLTGSGGLIYAGPNGGSGTITGSVTVAMVAYPVVFAGSANLTTEATTGSGKVTSG